MPRAASSVGVGRRVKRETALVSYRWCAAYDCGALWLLNFQDGGEGSRK